MKHFQAIAAMSRNRVIGQANRIPWHLPEDFKWFKQKTTGHVVLMGRNTFVSLGKPLPSRLNLVLTRDPDALRAQYPAALQEARVLSASADLAALFPSPTVTGALPTQIHLVNSVATVDPAVLPVEVFVIGGAQLYAALLPRCSDLFLTLVNREVEGDTFFPRFEDAFAAPEKILERPDFTIWHYRQRALASA